VLACPNYISKTLNLNFDFCIEERVTEILCLSPAPQYVTGMRAAKYNAICQPVVYSNDPNELKVSVQGYMHKLLLLV